MSADARPTRAPLTCVVVVIFTVRDNHPEVLLITRSADPERGLWALPGGLLLDGEGLDMAAARKLVEEAGVRDVYLEQLYSFDDLDPSAPEGSVAVSYFALVDASMVRLAPRDEWQAAWYPTNELPEVAFANDRVVEYALERLRNKLQYSNVVYSLMPEEFGLGRLQKVYESILDQTFDKRNFRKRILSLGIVEETGDVRAEGAHRPARIYRFIRREPTTF
ncbi:MAG: NUDIX domain-containing protein [Dehalococcoidia bacterium]|nr:NUDIX domain-containing protein [Dehalococcoidia bacterium]